MPRNPEPGDLPRSWRLRLVLVALLTLLAAFLVACGGTDDPKRVPADAVALVGDQPITRAAFASMLAANLDALEPGVLWTPPLASLTG
jgi:hypothetical protein